MQIHRAFVGPKALPPKSQRRLLSPPPFPGSRICCPTSPLSQRNKNKENSNMDQPEGGGGGRPNSVSCHTQPANASSTSSCSSPGRRLVRVKEDASRIRRTHTSSVSDAYGVHRKTKAPPLTTGQFSSRNLDEDRTP
ncbi:hypothetical protein AAFF_G00113170 [Aldrovandia affinis]|uniref:Uncharacterized protein n=1 Tax=Aldrovandia affinis TaxID=143900 RepID=A0AAD7WAT0_9TELE|nr:hypothetical protein AAFF_G00113170 [Aldrovandia affinis]